MTHYVVFLRAVNVGGHSTVKMGDLIKNLTKQGLEHVSSYRKEGAAGSYMASLILMITFCPGA